MQIDSAVIVAGIMTVGTLVAGGYSVYAQLRRDKAAAEQQAKNDEEEASLSKKKFQKEIEDNLWEKTQIELEKMIRHIDKQDAQIQKQDATIKEQGGLIMQLRDRIKFIEEERDTWMRRALTAEGRRGTGRNL